LDQHIGFLVTYKKAIEESSENFLELERKYGKTICCSLSCRH